MTEISGPWDGTVLGDASRSPYSAAEWSEMFRHLFDSQGNRGVLPRVLDELEVTATAANSVSVAPGAALVYGRWYHNDSAVSINVPSATATWREDCIVLRCNFSAQTIRAVRVENPSGEGVSWDDSMLTQSSSTQWEIPLAVIRVDTAGNITVTDRRIYAQHGHKVERELGRPYVVATWGYGEQTAYSYENLVYRFPEGDDTKLAWYVSIFDWDEQSDIDVNIYTLNAPLAAQADGGDSRWQLLASQLKGHCEDPSAYQVAQDVRITIAGSSDWHVAKGSFTLSYDDGFRRHLPLSLYLTRLHDDPLDTSTAEWRIFAATISYSA